MAAASLWRNFGWLSLGRVVADLFAFLLVLLLARTFGPEGSGRYGVAMSLAGFVAVAADFGLRAETLREAGARGREAAGWLGHAFSARLLVSTVALAALLAATGWLGLGGETRAVVVAIGVQQVLRRIAEGVGAVFVAGGESRVPALLEVATRAGGVLAAGALVLGGAGLGAALAVLPLVEAGHLAGALVLLWRRGVRLRLTLRPDRLAGALRSSAPYALGGVLCQLYSRSDVVLVGAWLGAGAAGVYHAADRVMLAVLMPVAYAAMLLLPLAARSHLAAPEADGARARRVLERVLFATLPAALGLMLVAPALVRVLFGAGFEPSAGLLRLLAPLLVLVGLSESLAALLLARGRVADRARHQAEAVVVNLAANALLLPLLGVAGAALAALATQLLLVLRHLGVLAPLLPAGARPARFVAPTLACVACACGLGFAPAAGTGIVLASAVVPAALTAALLPEALLRETRDLAGAWRRWRRGAPVPAFKAGELD